MGTAVTAACLRRVFSQPALRRMSSSYPYPCELVEGSLRDPLFPGTACERLANVLERVAGLSEKELSGEWKGVRSALLRAGGLMEDRSTSHAFNDDNHCDLTTMQSTVKSNCNANGAVAGISRRNQLGPHIEKASLKEVGAGGSWSTCTNGCHENPPNDVAHTQFRSRIAFKLVWCPPEFTSFVLVDDEGRLLKSGTPSGNLPHLQARAANYGLVQGGVYATAAEAWSK